MDEARAPDIEEIPENPGSDEPGLRELVAQLGDDAVAFVRAETDYLKAQLDDRGRSSRPALYALGFGWATMFGTMITLPFALILMLTPYLGPVWSVILVSGGSLAGGRALIWFGWRRLKKAIKGTEDSEVSR